MAKIKRSRGSALPRNMIEDALKEFNRWHGSEAAAEIVEVKQGTILVEMGQFCLTCGVYDYFDDLKIELEKKLGRPVKVSWAEEKDERYLIAFKVI